MDSIKAQKLKAMKNYKKAQFVYNLVVYSLTAFLSTLFYLYMFCFPSMRQFLFDFLPNIYSFFLNPKFLFLLGNIIIVILVGESKLAGSRSSLATEIYDEYVERSRSLKRQSIVECKKKDGNTEYVEGSRSLKRQSVVECKKKDGNIPEMNKNEKSRMRRHCSLNNIRCLEAKDKEMAGRSLRRPLSVVERKKDAGRLEIHVNEKTTVTTRDDDLYNIRCPEENSKETAVDQSLTISMSLGNIVHMQYENGETTMATRGDDLYNIRCLEGKRKARVGQSLTRPMSLGTLQVLDENEETTMATGGDDPYNNRFPEEKRNETAVSQSLTRPQSLGRLDMHENEKSSTDENKMSREEKRKEMEQSTDELNRRVEDFIARVNRQRMLEARELDYSLD